MVRATSGPARLEMAWGTVESNRFGTHEFLDYMEALGIEPYICANLGTGSWTEAQQWVEYCNVAEGTAMTKLRKQNGRQKPWKVKYWGLGNEMDGPWQMGHRTAEDYGKFALEAAKLMKWTDPNVQADRGGFFQLPRGFGLGGLEPRGAGLSEGPHRVSLAAHVRGQRGERLLRFPGGLESTGRPHPDGGRASFARRRAAAPAESDLHCVRRMERLVSGARRQRSAAGRSWRSTTTWKTRWWLRPC